MEDARYHFIQKKGYEETESNIIISHSSNLLTIKSVPPTSQSDHLYSKSKSRGNFVERKLLNWLKEVFLPQGYPHSVSSDYLQYQIWDSLQAYCSNLAGALSLHSTLVGIGVGQENASPLAAAISWLTKDGAGMLSSITFAYYKGSELDYNSKQWRLFADIANDGAHFIRLLAPVLPFPFLVIFCASSIMSSLVGVAGGATRASLIQHQALCNNMADVSAKDGSQETLVNLAGLVTSLTLLPFLTSSPIITWTAFTLLVCLHIYTNFKAMRTIQMTTLNRPRLLHIFDWFASKCLVPDVITTNQCEPLFRGPAFIQSFLIDGFRLEAGVPLDYISGCLSNMQDEFKQMVFVQVGDFEDTKYMIFLNINTKVFYVLFHEEAKSVHVVEAFWASYLCAINMHHVKKKDLSEKHTIDRYENTTDLVAKGKQLAKATFNTFLSQLLKKEWQVDPLRLNIGEWRLRNRKYL